MKTEALIDLLAKGADPVRRHAAMRRILGALAIGAAGALALLLYRLDINPGLSDFVTTPQFWIKTGFTLSLATAGVMLSQRLARPGVRVGNAVWLAIAPVVAIWLLAVAQLTGAEAATRTHLVFGNSWNVCPKNIAMLSLPLFVAIIWGMRGLAPTESRSAGAAAGLCAGALAAVVYGIHCPERSAPFLAIWYVTGILIPTAVGAALGPRLLRW